MPRRLPAPDRSVLENEFFNSLLDIVLTLHVPRVYSFFNLAGYDLGNAVRVFVAFRGWTVGRSAQSACGFWLSVGKTNNQSPFDVRVRRHPSVGAKAHEIRRPCALYSMRSVYSACFSFTECAILREWSYRQYHGTVSRQSSASRLVDHFDPKKISILTGVGPQFRGNGNAISDLAASFQ